MPISIPMMQRRGSGGLGGDSGGRGDLFVPPHVLSRQESDGRRQEELGAAASVGGLSPTTAAKRERLFVRNQILRSTGFLEVQHSAPVIGEPAGGAAAAGGWLGWGQADAQSACGGPGCQLRRRREGNGGVAWRQCPPKRPPALTLCTLLT